MDGILLVDKPIGITSREADNLVKKILDSPGVGHLGTLDPFASGLLILGIGRGTKLFPFMEDFDKTYVATLKLGEKTDTGELNGKVIQAGEVPDGWKEKLNAVLDSFLGLSSQVPPSYSAKHVDGKRAYELAREGREFELKPQTVEIKELKALEVGENSLAFVARVSRGTYIRTLGEDIAERLGTVGHLTSLRRTAIGHFHTKEEIKGNADRYSAVQLDSIGIDSVLSMEEATSYLTSVEVSGKHIRQVENGSPLNLDEDLPELVRILIDGNLRAIYRRAKKGLYRCARGFYY